MESAVVARVIQALRVRGVWVVKIHGGPSQAAGLPDLIALHEGRFYAFEVKDPRRPAPVTPLQINTLAEIDRHGGHAWVIHSPEDALRAVFGPTPPEDPNAVLRRAFRQNR